MSIRFSRVALWSGAALLAVIAVGGAMSLTPVVALANTGQPLDCNVYSVSVNLCDHDSVGSFDLGSCDSFVVNSGSIVNPKLMLRCERDDDHLVPDQLWY